MRSICTLRPVNKLASVVVNQCGCSDELQLNSLIEQRNQLKANASMWMKESSTSIGLKRKNNPLIRAANIELTALNKKLKPYDEWHRSNTPKDYDHAFRMIVKKVFGAEIFNQIEMQAKAAIGETL